MAMQSGIGLSKIIILVGAGYTGSIVLKNGHLPDILADLQTLLKDKSRDDGSTDSDYSDALAAQVRRLAMEVRQLASSPPVTILNGASSAMGSVSSLAVPAAALGALGYGYMWWKGLSFSDLMYVTKQNMASAVASLTKNLEDVTAALAAAKRHLTQRIENLDGKLDEQKEMSKLIKDEVTIVRDDISQIGYDLDALQKLVDNLGGKIDTLEDKQDFANSGIYYLLRFVSEKDGRKIPDFLQDVPRPSNKRGHLGYDGHGNLKGLQFLTDSLGSTVDESKTSPKKQNDRDSLDMASKSLARAVTSIKC